MWMLKSPRELTGVIVKRPSKLDVVKWSGYLMKICDQGNPHYKRELQNPNSPDNPCLVIHIDLSSSPSFRDQSHATFQVFKCLHVPTGHCKCPSLLSGSFFSALLEYL